MQTFTQHGGYVTAIHKTYLAIACCIASENTSVVIAFASWRLPLPEPEAPELDPLWGVYNNEIHY